MSHEKKQHLDVDDTAQLLDTVQENVSLLDSLLVLCVLCIGSVSLHNSIDLVDHTVQTSSRDELGKIPIKIVTKYVHVSLGTFKDPSRNVAWSLHISVFLHVLVNKLLADAERMCHALHGQGAVRLQELSISTNSHLTDIVSVVGEQDPRTLHGRGLQCCQGHEKLLVVACVQ